MINAQTIVMAKYPDARCIVGHDPKDDRQLDYYFIVVDGEDNPVIQWGYSPEEAWDAAAKKIMLERCQAVAQKAYEMGYRASEQDQSDFMNGTPRCSRKHVPDEITADMLV